MWLRGSLIDCSIPTSMPIACGVPRESRNESEPLTGTRAAIRERSWLACSINWLKSRSRFSFLAFTAAASVLVIVAAHRAARGRTG